MSLRYRLLNPDSRDWFRLQFCALLTEPYILLISGSRKPSNGPKAPRLYRQTFERIRIFAEWVAGMFPPELTIQGDADGVDSIFRDVFKAKGLTTVDMPADWDTHGKSAGPRRNADMRKVANSLSEYHGIPVLCLAMPGPKSRGTVEMIKACDRLKITCFEMAIEC